MRKYIVSIAREDEIRSQVRQDLVYLQKTCRQGFV